jgi:hypothetical protein
MKNRGNIQSDGHLLASAHTTTAERRGSSSCHESNKGTLGSVRFLLESRARGAERRAQPDTRKESHIYPSASLALPPSFEDPRDDELVRRRLVGNITGVHVS